MTGLLRSIDRLCALAAGLAAVLVAILFLLGLAELLQRNIADISLPFATEYAGYLLAAILTLPLGHVMTQGRHIRVALAFSALPEGLRRTLDIAATLIGLAVAATLAAALLHYAAVTAEDGARSYFASQTPLAIPQAVACIGPVTLVLALVARLIRLVHGEAVAL
jgi:TRAP-type C4-dicarboxylate transport system permease small subunit